MNELIAGNALGTCSSMYCFRAGIYFLVKRSGKKRLCSPHAKQYAEKNEVALPPIEAA